MGNDDEAWKALCAFARNPVRSGDPREPWDVTTTPPKPKSTRKRRMTLARAMKQADRAGVKVGSVVMKPDGVTLELGEASNQPNPWDSVQ
jgi:hypothetical protein